MALIGKIRQNFWFVLIILGLALAAFVVMDMTSANRGSAMNPTIGTINGTKINVQEFSRTESILSQNGGTQDPNQQRESLWSYFVDRTVIEDEVEDLGINVPVEELKDLQFGQNLSPIIEQGFFDPNIGQVNRQQLAQIQNAIATNTGLTPEFRNFWYVQEGQVVTEKIQNKLNNLVKKGIYSPTWQVNQEYKQGNTRAQVAYVKVPFDAISNDEVEVSDSDIKAYLNDHKDEYSNDEEMRIIDYITFDVIATSADTLAAYNNMVNKTAELARTESDSTFALNNGGSKPAYYYSKDELPESLKAGIDGLEVDSVFGPYLDNGVYTAVKLVDQRSVPDSVEARVIFRQAPTTNTAAIDAARILLDSLKTMVESGAGQFDSLAITNSQDGSASRGGDLGYVTQGLLPFGLDNALFLGGNREGEIIEAQTDQGLFLIEITDIIRTNRDDKYRVANIVAPIIPSAVTEDSVLNIVNDFLSDNRTLESLNENAQAANYFVQSSPAVDRNDYQLGNLGIDQSSRNIIRWAFDSYVEEGDVSPDFYSYTDPINYYTSKYVIAGLSSIIPEGVSTVDAVRDQLTPLVRNMKKGELIKSKMGSDLNAVASEYGVSVDTLAAVTMASTVIPSLGNEPGFVAAAFSTGENNVSSPILGNSGVYILKPIAIAGAGEVSSVPSLRNSSMIQNRSKVEQSLLESLRKTAKIKDGRFEYGY